MNPKYIKEVLTHLRPSHRGVPGNEHFNFLEYGFYDFEGYLGLSRDDYEKFIVEMGRNGWISIKFKDNTGYERAVVTGTAKGMDYLEELNKI